MSPTPSRAMLLILALAALAAPGCQRGGSGEWRLFGQKPPVSATSIQVTRRTTAAGNRPAERQQLMVNLETGEAVFIDTDRSIHPHQISRATVDRLREIIAERTWQVGRQEPAKDAQDPIYYTLTAFDEGRAVESPASWVRPERRALPPALRYIEQVFERSERFARPLSDRVDLLQ